MKCFRCQEPLEDAGWSNHIRNSKITVEAESELKKHTWNWSNLCDVCYYSLEAYIVEAVNNWRNGHKTHEMV